MQLGEGQGERLALGQWLDLPLVDPLGSLRRPVRARGSRRGLLRLLPELGTAVEAKVGAQRLLDDL